MLLDVTDAETIYWLSHYVARLGLPAAGLRVTTSRAEFERLLGRRISSSAGGAYVYLPRSDWHLILINLPRIDRAQPRALEVVVAEELIHYRDWLDGDRRRHARHGYDRIAHRVAALTGASLDEIRRALIPVERRPARYLYQCPGCQQVVPRRRRGTWSCARCAPAFDRRFVLRLVVERPRAVTERGDDEAATRWLPGEEERRCA